MPRVPTYDGPQVQPTALPGAMQEVPSHLQDAFTLQARQGVALGEKMVQASHVLDQMQIEDDEAAATRAHGQFVDAVTGILHGTAEQPGILALHGQNAVDAADPTAKALDAARDKIAQSLGTQRAKDLFLRAAAHTQHTSGEQIADHVLVSREKATDDASQLRASAAASAAVAAYTPGTGPDVADLRVLPGERGTDETQWDKRADGSAKGHGFLGLLRRPDGKVSSELSVGVELDGKETDIPLLVPTLTRKEVDTLLAVPTDKDFFRNLPRSVLDKAVAFARQRKAAGLDVFADAHESAAAENSAYSTYLQTQQVELRNQAERRGLSPEAVADYVTHGMSKTYADVVTKLANDPQSAGAARTYLADHRDHIVQPSELARLDSLVNASTAQSSALHLAASLGTEHPGDWRAQYAELDRRADAGELDPDTLRLARAEVSARQSESNAGRADAEDALFGRAREIANAGGAISQLPAADLAYLKTNGSLGVRVDALFKGRGEALDDAKLFNDLMRQSRDDPSAFLRADISTMAGQLSNGHFDYLVKLQGSLDKQSIRAGEISRVMGGAVKLAWQSINAAGINLRAKPGTSGATRAEQFNARLHDALIAAQEIKGEDKPLTHEEARDITLGLLKEETLAGTGVWGLGMTARRPYEMSDEQLAQPWVIPADARAEIVTALRKKQQPTTEENIQRVFKMHHGVY